MDAGHDGAELLIDFFCGPGKSLGVLAHLKAADENAAGIGCLGRCNDNVLTHEILESLIGGRHVGDFDVVLCSVGNDLLCDLQVNLVLGSARHDDVCLDAKRLLAREELCACELVSIVCQLALACTAVKQEVDLILGYDAGLIKDVACGTGDGDRLCAELSQLLGSAPGDIAVTGQDDGLALDAVILVLQGSLQIVDRAVSGSLGTDQRTAVGAALAGQDAVFECAADPAVLAIEEADLSAADTDITCRYVDIRTDMTIELGHEGLTEAHHFGIALALRIEVGAALAAAHGQGGKAVLEGLLEGKELHHGKGNGRMETKSSLVRSDRAVELYAVAAVDMHLSVVILPRNAELDHALGLGHTL